MTEWAPTIAIVIVISVLVAAAFWGWVISWIVYLVKYLMRWVQSGNRPVDFTIRDIMAERRKSKVVPIIALFILMLGITFFMAINGKTLLAICLGIMAFIILMLLVLKKQKQNEETELLTRMRAVNRKGLFDREIYALAAAWHSVLLKKDFFLEHNETESITESYQMISDAIEHDINSAINFMEHYDWVLKPDPKYLRKLCSHAQDLAKKLSELSDIVLEINDSASDVDVSFAENMLASLKEML